MANLTRFNRLGQDIFFISNQENIITRYKTWQAWATFTVKNEKYVNPLETSNKPETPKQEKSTPTPIPKIQTGWSGNSYYQNGKKVINNWVFDVHYNSYYFINVNGNYVQNAWSGNYYLKSNGKMAVNERTPDGYRVDASGKWIR